MSELTVERFTERLLEWWFNMHDVDSIWTYFKVKYKNDKYVKVFQDEYKDKYYITDNKWNNITTISFAYNSNYNLLLSFMKFTINQIETMKKDYFK